MGLFGNSSFWGVSFHNFVAGHLYIDRYGGAYGVVLAFCLEALEFVHRFVETAFNLRLITGELAETVGALEVAIQGFAQRWFSPLHY